MWEISDMPWIFCVLLTIVFPSLATEKYESTQILSTGCRLMKCTTGDRVGCKVSFAGSEFELTEQFSGGYSEGWPGRPTHVNITETRSASGHIRIRISWRLPDDASYKTVTGFYLKVMTVSNAAVGFYFAINQSDLLNVDFPEVLSLVFYYDCLEFERSTEELIVFIYSLPMPPTGNLFKNFLVTFYSITSGTHDDWVSSISDFSIIPSVNLSQTCGHMVNFSFSVAPTARLAFDVQLFYVQSHDRPKTVADIRNTRYALKPIFTFNSLCSGKYKIQVWPSEQDRYGKCVCGVLDTTTNECKNCVRIPLFFKLDPVKAVTTPVTENAKQSSRRQDFPLQLVFGILTLICLVVGIAIALVLFSYYKKYFTAPNVEQYSFDLTESSGRSSTSSGLLSTPTLRPPRPSSDFENSDCGTLGTFAMDHV